MQWFSMRELSLFTGYAGFSLGLRLAGLPTRTIGYCDNDTYIQKLLQARIKDGYIDDAPIISDIRADWTPYRGLVDIITAGFPCQPHSHAGKRKGEADERNLWPDTRRCISEVEPRFVLLENVPGIISNGYAGVVAGELSEIGYDAVWGLVSAADIGAPHLRKRWWCFAWLADSEIREPWQSQAWDRGKGTQRRSEQLADSDNSGDTSSRYGTNRNEQTENQGRKTWLVTEPTRSSEQLADSDTERYRGWSSTERGDGERFVQSEEQGRSEVGSETKGCNRDMADSDISRSREDRQSSKLWTERTEQSSSNSRSPGEREDGEVETEGMADSNEQGLERWESKFNNQERWEEPPRPSGLYGRAWPPSPSDRDAWERVIRERPDLAPAITKEAERQFRGVDDGTSNRVDRLKACGNGIVPAVVAEFLRRIT